MSFSHTFNSGDTLVIDRPYIIKLKVARHMAKLPEADVLEYMLETLFTEDELDVLDEQDQDELKPFIDEWAEHTANERGEKGKASKK